jgi:YVTN family beta-propeller protein
MGPLAAPRQLPAWSHDGYLVVCNQQDGNADLVDLRQGKSIKKIATGVGPHEAAVSPDAKTAIVTNYGTGAVMGRSLTVIGLPGGEVVKTIELGDYTRPHGAAWLDGDRVAVTSETTQNVVVVNIAKGLVERAISTGFSGSHMLAVPADKQMVFTANIGPGNVSAIDLSKGVKIGEATAGERSEGIAVSPDGTRIITANLGGSITIIDAKALKALKTIETGGSPYRAAFSPDGKTAYVPNPMTGELIVVDVVKLELAKRIPAPADPKVPNAGPTGVFINPNGKFAYVSLPNASSVGVIDLLKGEVVARIPVGKSPDGVAFAKG